MSADVEARGAAVEVTVAGDLTVDDVRALHADLLARVGPATAVTVRASGVTRLDAAAAQLFVALAAHAGSLDVADASPAWGEAFRLLGLQAPRVLREA